MGLLQRSRVLSGFSRYFGPREARSVRHNRLPDFIRYVAASATCQADLDDYINAIQTTPATHSGAVVIKGAFAGRYMVQ